MFLSLAKYLEESPFNEIAQGHTSDHHGRNSQQNGESSQLKDGTLIPSAQPLVWAAKQPLGKAALGALFA